MKAFTLPILKLADFFFLFKDSDAIEGNCAQQPSEISAVPCPRIDTQQLDRQIKAIMKEVIPFLKVI